MTTSPHRPRSKSYTVRSVTFRVVREPGATAPTRLDTPAKVAALARAFILDDGREHFCVLMLNAALHVLGVHEVAVGTADAVLVSPRDVFGPALRVLSVTSIILCHNHPSGDPTPSRADVKLTKQIVEAGKVLDIKVHDHVIVGSGSEDHVSLVERGEM